MNRLLQAYLPRHGKSSTGFQGEMMMHRLRFSFGKGVVSVLLVAGVVASLGGWTLAWGQTNQGAIAGNIMDQSGAVVPDADITAVGVNTGSRYHAISTNAGVYSFPNMSIGTYNITVVAKGFKKELRANVEVQVGTTTALNIALHVGAASETITVESNAPTVQTETSDIGVVLTEQQQLDLPLPLGGAIQYMREPESFVFLAPGTVGPGTGSGSGGTFESKISGSQSYSTEVLLDGASQFRSENGSSFSETAPSVEALTEFKLTTSTLPAYLGRTTGGIESFSTRAGTNAYHGSAYDIIANTAFDANNWGNNLALADIKAGLLPNTAAEVATFQRVPDKQNDYGLALGGPIRVPFLYNGHDKSFFFFAWEQFNEHGGGVTTSTVPTAKEVTGDFSELLGGAIPSSVSKSIDCLGHAIRYGEIFDPKSTSTINNPALVSSTNLTGVQTCRTPFGGATPTNIIPSGYVNTVGSTTIGKNIIGFYPAPQTSGTQNNYVYAYPFNTLATATTFRFDQNMKGSQKVYFTYSSRENVRPSTTGTWHTASGDPRFQDFTTHYLRFGYDIPVGTSMLNHINLGYNRTNSKNIGAGVADGGGKDWDTASLGITGAGNGGGVTFPNVNNTTNFSGWTNMGDSVDGDTIDNGYRLNENFDWIKNKHTFRFGYDYRYQVFNPINAANQSGTFAFNSFTTAGSPDTATGNTGLGQASMYLGLVGSASTNAYVTQPKFVYSYWALFAQDDWKIKPNLTLNIGFRYDVDVPRRSAHDNTSNIDMSVPNPGAPGEYGALVFAGVGPGRNGVAGETWAKTYRHDYGPRFGFSWSPTLPGNLAGKTVVHGGAGIYYAALVMADFGADMLTGFQATPSFNSTDGFSPAFNLGTGFPAFTQPPNLDSTQLNYGSPTYVDPKNGRPGMTMNWSLDIQEQIAKDMILDVGYVGTRATHMRSQFDRYNDILPANLKYGALLNQPLNSASVTAAGLNKLPYIGGTTPFAANGLLANALRPMPQYLGFNSDCCLENLGQSGFQALEVSMQRRWRDNLNLMVAYTYSKTLTDADSALPVFSSWHGGGSIQNPYDDKGEKAISNQDLPHVLVISYLYQLPFGKGRTFLNNNKIADEVVGGWQIGGIHRYQSGQPLSFGTTNSQITQAGYNLRFSRVKAQSLKSPALAGGSFNPAKQPANFGISSDNYSGTNPNPNRYFNYASMTDPNAAFSAPGSGAWVFGNMPRTTGELRSYKYLTEDFSLVKRFPIYDRVKLQVKGEMIDAFNRHIFNRPNTDGPTDAAGFGYVNPTAMDNGNAGGAPGDGGPRRVQFTLKLEY
jgi:hypothetical protein